MAITVIKNTLANSNVSSSDFINEKRQNKNQKEFPFEIDLSQPLK